ncbi:hypothetical protein ABZ865_02180 [Streptomyces sp. NPDC047085]|uniref:hypothetical protein n=1 Tax=Streptomyces sp. NPDC047085 TaxID=3155140 RepID=UPI0033D1B6B7
MPEFRKNRTVRGAVAAVALIAVSACSSGATSDKEASKLASSQAAVRARQQAQQALLRTIRSYDQRTSLTLTLTVVRDMCLPGRSRQWIDSNGDDSYKVNCTMRATAYYGADRKHVGDVLDSIFTAGDQHGTGITLGHTYYGDHLVAYYRGKGPNPLAGSQPKGQEVPEPTPELFDASQTLAWDPVHPTRADHPVAEPDPCPAGRPPLIRCTREPAHRTVAETRRQYSMLFELDLTAPEYYKVTKKSN